MTKNRIRQYLNNIVEKDHRFIKITINPMLGFKSLSTAEKTIAGIEVVYMISKGQIEEARCVCSEVHFINEIMNEVA